jgi:hypothetical protein
MLQMLNRIFVPSRSALVGKAIAIAMLSAVAACGDGSTAGTSDGTKIRAVTKAVPNANAAARRDFPPQASDAALRVTPLDPVVKTTFKNALC